MAPAKERPATKTIATNRAKKMLAETIRQERRSEDGMVSG